MKRNVLIPMLCFLLLVLVAVPVMGMSPAPAPAPAPAVAPLVIEVVAPPTLEMVAPVPEPYSTITATEASWVTFLAIDEGSLTLLAVFTIIALAGIVACGIVLMRKSYENKDSADKVWGLPLKYPFHSG